MNFEAIPFETWWSEVGPTLERPSPEGALTVAELRERTGHSRELLRRILGEAKRRGVVRVTRVRREALDGRETTVPAYVLVQDPGLRCIVCGRFHVPGNGCKEETQA